MAESMPHLSATFFFAQPEIAGTWRWHLTIIRITVSVYMYVYIGCMPVWVGNYLPPPL